MYEKLQHDHIELLALSAQIKAELAVDTPVDSASLWRSRWKMTRLVAQHLAVEDIQVYRKLARDPRPAAIALSRRYEQELGQLLAAFNAHVAHWSAEAVQEDWPGFRKATFALLEALETRIACEENELYPLLKSVDKHAA